MNKEKNIKRSRVSIAVGKTTQIINDRHERDQSWTYDPRLVEYTHRYTIADAALAMEDDGTDAYLNAVHAMSFFVTKNGSLPGSETYKKEVYEEGLSVVDPAMIELVKQISDKEDYNPIGITPVKFDQPLNIPASPAYRAPPVHPMIIGAQLRCQAKFGDNHTYPFLAAHAKHNGTGVKVTLVTAQDKEAIKRAVFKNARYTGTDFPTKELYLAGVQIATQFKLHTKQLDLSFDYYPTVDLFDKNSSMGYIPTKFFKTNSQGFTRPILNPKKRDAPGAPTEALFRFKEECAAYLRGEVDKVPSLGPEIESHKLELLHWVQAFEWGDKTSTNTTDNMQYKQRLFYISSAIAFGLDKTVFGGLSNVARYFMSAIGIEVTNGGLLEMSDLLTGSEASPLYERWEEIAEKWEEKEGIDLRERVYGEGDWESYDMTLAMKLLAFVVGIVFTMYKKSVLSDPLLRLLLAIAHRNNVVKVMYVYLFNTFFRVVGRFLSGKFGTSFMGTLCSMMLFMCYRARLMDKYPGDELLSDILGNWMFIPFFYSDDHIAGWPKVLERYKLHSDSKDPWDDFVRMCIDLFGMRYKLGFEERFSSMVGEVHFVTTTTGYKQLIERTVPSPSFLKFRIVQVYLDDEPIYQPIPMKDLLEVVTKLGYGVKSSASPDRELAKVIALAHLNTNLEGYSVLRHYYDELVRSGATLSPEQLEAFLSDGESHSFHLLRQSGSVSPEFPSLASIFEKQYEGYRNKTGFCPRDPYGNKILAPDKYELWNPQPSLV